MRDRLIELIRDRCKYEHCLGKNDLGICKNSCEATTALADYLLKNGVIVPPCKVGSTLYRIDTIGVKCSHENSYYDEYWCGGCPHREIGDCDARKEPYIFVMENAKAQTIFGNEHLFGTRVFLTREEAEEALERSENGK